jgi:hypothetical protein
MLLSHYVMVQDLGLLDRDRRLICTGEFLHHSDVGLVRSVWNELFCLLADNYCK